MKKEKYMTLKETELLYKKINKYLKENNFDLKLEDIIELEYNIRYLFDDLSNFELTPRDILLLSCIEDFKYYDE